MLAVALAANTPLAEEPRQIQYDLLRWFEDWRWVTPRDRVENRWLATKNVALGGNWSFDFLASVRIRGEWDENRTLGASPAREDALVRLRTFFGADFRYRESLRFVLEGRYSTTLGSERPVPGVFENDPDFANTFVEYTALPETDHPVAFRLGRQELLFAAQRLVSPLDWSNTRNFFDGLTVTGDTKRHRSVFFATYPVAHFPSRIDEPIDELAFTGIHSYFFPAAGHRVDGYVYYLDDSRQLYESENDPRPGMLQRWTVGARWFYSHNGWMFDVDGAGQLGDVAGDDLEAFMLSFTGAYTWNRTPWKPSLNIGLDLASGDDDPTDGRNQTFDQLFPLAHAYLGHIDLVARQNIRVARLQFGLNPRKRFTCVLFYHWFELDSPRDALYNAGAIPIRRDPTGASGREVATELDVLWTWNFAKNHFVGAEIMRWWSDSFIEATGDPDDAWRAWLGYELRY